MDELGLILDSADTGHLFLIVLIAIVTRSLPRFICPDARGNDAYYHLHAAQRIKLNRYRIPHTLELYALPGIYDYPPLLHYVWALFPESWHLQVERFSSAIVDAIYASMVYLVSIYLATGLNASNDISSRALCITILFLMSPALTSVGTGPRAYQGTPRPLGELFFFLSFSATLLYKYESDPLMLLLAGFCGALLLLTSKFGAQVFFFFHLIVIGYYRELEFLIIPFLSIAFSFLLSKGYYRIIARGHWEHCRYYRNAIVKRFYLVTNKNRWTDLKNLLTNLVKNPVAAARTLLMDNTYLIMLIQHPQLFYIPFVWKTIDGSAGLIQTFLAMWIFAGLIIFILTSLKPFLFLGEAERYLEYVLFPQLFLIAATDTFFSFFYYLIIYEIIIYLAYTSIFIYTYSQKAKSLDAFKEMATFINSEPTINKVLPIYLNDAIQLAYDSGKKIAHFPGNLRDQFFKFAEFLFFYAKVYPFPNENLQALMKRYHFDTVYFSNEDMHKAQRFGLKYDFQGWDVKFSNTNFKVLQPPSL